MSQSLPRIVRLESPFCGFFFDAWLKLAVLAVFCYAFCVGYESPLFSEVNYPHPLVQGAGFSVRILTDPSGSTINPEKLRSEHNICYLLCEVTQIEVMNSRAKLKKPALRLSPFAF